MISVPNRRLRSSGNNTFLLVLLLLFLGSSCKLLQKVPSEEPTTDKEDKEIEIVGPKQIDPETGELMEVVVLALSMDTIQWTIRSKTKFPPIQSDTPLEPVAVANGTTSPAAGAARMSLFLPFLANRFDPLASEVPESSTWALQFYAGAQMAIDKLKEEKVNLQVLVYDTEFSPEKTRELLVSDKNIRESSLIIGPYRSVNAQLMANFSKQFSIPCVSPYSANEQVTSDNPYYIQINPSLRTHCEAIARHVKTRYKNNQVVLVVRDRPDELECLQYIQQAAAAMGTSFDTTSFRKLVINDNTAELSNTNLSNYLSSDQTTVFIVPSYKEESFVYSFLRKLKIDKTDYGEVVVYGMPKWKEFGQVIDFQLYEDLNVHITSSFYANDYDPAIRAFKRNFFERFGVTPREEAYTGYETILYFGRLITKYPGRFLVQIDREDYTNLYTKFQFRPVRNNPSPFDEQINRVDRIENQFVHVLRFRDFFFQEAE